MLPDPEPSDAEYTLARVIMMVSDEEIESVISSISTQGRADATWALAVEAMEAWPEVFGEDGSVKKIGSIEFFENKHISTRLDLRNYLRRLYGLDALLNETGSSLTSVSSLQWFHSRC